VLTPRLIAPLLGVVVAGALLPWTWGLDVMARGLGPGFWPRAALIGLGLACVAKLVEEVQRGRAGTLVAPRDTSAPISRGTLAGGIALIVGYVLLTPHAGFALTTALFIAAFLLLCGARSVPGIVANVAIGTVGLLYLFVKLVYLPLPKGDGPFEALTLGLYRALRLF
jgi:hypothetical protein